MNRERTRWLCALLMAAALMALTCALSGVVFQTNDDNTIVSVASGGVSGDGEPYNSFTSYGYGWLLCRLYRLCADIPWHGLGMFLLQGLCLAAVLRSVFYLCAQKGAAWWKGLAGFLALYAGVAMKFMCYLQFTATAGYCSGAAACLLFTLPEGRKARRLNGLCALGVMACALLLRPKGGLLGLPVPLLAALYRGLKKDRAAFRWGCALAAVAIGLMLSDTLLTRLLVPGLTESQTFDEASAVVLDYQNTDHTYALALEVTDWNPALCACFRNWNLLFDHRFNTQNLTRLAQAVERDTPSPTLLQVAHKTLSVLRRYQEFGWNALGWGLCSLWLMAVLFRRRDWQGLLLTLALWLSLGAVIALFYGWLNRLPDRVAFVYALPVYALLLMLLLEHQPPVPLAACALLVAAAALVTVGLRGEDIWVRNNPRREMRAQITQQANDYASAHPDMLYVTDVTQGFYAFETETPPVNLVEWGSGLVRSPAYQHKFRRLGYPEGLDTRHLADENVRLLMSSSASLRRLQNVLEADGLDWTLVEEESFGSLTLCRLQKR